MPRPWRITYSRAKYHITSRGNARQQIFFKDEDCERFLEQLKAAIDQDEVILYAYCLMPNHYHLLIETPLGNVKRFMQRLNTAYSMYFRYKHSKPGHCFQGRYGAKLAGGDEYLVRLTRYIHLNPVQSRKMKEASIAERMRYLNGYKWSSYLGYIDKAEEIIDYRWLCLMGRRTMRGNRARYRKYIEEMAGKEDDKLKQAFSTSRYAIGDERFVEEAETDIKEMRLAKACGGGDTYRPRERIAQIEKIEQEVAKELRVKSEILHEHGHKASLAKKVAIELSCQLTGKSQREIGGYYGYTSDSSVVKQRQRLRDQMTKDPKLAQRISRLKKRIMKQYSIIKAFSERQSQPPM